MSENGIKKIEDLIDDNNRFLTYQMFLDKCNVNINAITYYGIISVIKKHYSTDDLEMTPPLITNMLQRKDISTYIFKYFIEKDERENFAKGIVKWSKISLPRGSPTDSVRWSLLLGYRNYIMYCFLFPFCVITCYLEVYDAEV
jgi:hypothetical protein